VGKGTLPPGCDLTPQLSIERVVLEQLFELWRNDHVVGVGDVELNGHRIAKEEGVLTPHLELRGKNIAVHGIFPGAVDTDMIAAMEMPKTSPAEVATAIVDGVAGGAEEIFPDAMARQLGQLWLANPKQLEAQFAAM
jgi:hypothetical protein